MELASVDIAVDLHVPDLTGRKKPQCIHHMYEVIEDHPPRHIGAGTPILLKKNDSALGLVGQRSVHWCVAPIEPDHQEASCCLGKGYQSTRGVQRVSERLINIHMHP